MGRPTEKDRLKRALERAGQVWVTIPDLEAYLDISERTVRRHLKTLIDKELVEWRSDPTSEGVGRPRFQYRIQS